MNNGIGSTLGKVAVSALIVLIMGVVIYLDHVGMLRSAQVVAAQAATPSITKYGTVVYGPFMTWKCHEGNACEWRADYLVSAGGYSRPWGVILCRGLGEQCDDHMTIVNIAALPQPGDDIWVYKSGGNIKIIGTSAQQINGAARDLQAKQNKHRTGLGGG